MSAGAGLPVLMGSAQSINKCLRNTNAGPGSTGGLRESRPPRRDTAASVGHLRAFLPRVHRGGLQFPAPLRDLEEVLLREREGGVKAAPC